MCAQCFFISETRTTRKLVRILCHFEKQIDGVKCIFMMKIVFVGSAVFCLQELLYFCISLVKYPLLLLAYQTVQAETVCHLPKLE